MAESSDSLEQGNSKASDAELFTPAYLENRRRALDQSGSPRDLDDGDPRLPAGHAYAVRKSTWITSEFRRVHRKGAMDITPQDVIDALNAGGEKNWVLMGLHGYVGYMPNPRATQDVDIMVPYSERQRAKKAITARWPTLKIRELSQVTRFGDPADLDAEGHPKQVIDLMHPWSPFQELILKEYVIVDEATQHRLPTLEAAIASRYAIMRSANADRAYRDQNDADFRRLAKANRGNIKEVDLHRLASLVWEGGANEIARFIEIAVSDGPFPI
ncbi:MAG TPA: hypothetical protein VJ828_04560 [Lacipirellulaceae bacterium]|nr:hypothetical protein [Lacipirellulaceae bacterium]